MPLYAQTVNRPTVHYYAEVFAISNTLGCLIISTSLWAT